MARGSTRSPVRRSIRERWKSALTTPWPWSMTSVWPLKVRGPAKRTAPAAGTVLFAGPLTLSGQTLVIDHGQGVVSALFHLSRIDLRTGDRVEPRAIVGLSGDSGIAPTPLLQWRTYVHGVAVDPSVLQQLLN